MFIPTIQTEGPSKIINVFPYEQNRLLTDKQTEFLLNKQYQASVMNIELPFKW